MAKTERYLPIIDSGATLNLANMDSRHHDADITDETESGFEIIQADGSILKAASDAKNGSTPFTYLHD